MSRGGSYAQIFEKEQRIMHLKSRPGTAKARLQNQPQHPNDGYFAYPPDPSLVKVASHSQQEQHQQQQQQQQQQQHQPQSPHRSPPSHAPEQYQSPSQQHLAPASPGIREGGERPPANSTFIAGFPGMDMDRKSAAGSGGEKTLRHRMFPFHDLPADGDPHRAMHRPVGGYIAEQREKNFHGINVINEPYVHPQPFYTKPPPPRTVSACDKLMQPEVFKVTEQEASPKNGDEYSTKFKPKYDGSQSARFSRADVINPISHTIQPGYESKEETGPDGDAHRHYYDDIFRTQSPNGRTHNQTRITHAQVYDPSRAGYHSRDAQSSAKKQGIKQVPNKYYTTSSFSLNYAADNGVGGVPVPTPAEKEEMARRVAGRPLTAYPQPGEGTQKSGDDSSAGARAIGVERRPGSKAINDKTLQMRASSQVASLMTNDVSQYTGSGVAPLPKPNGRMNMQQRQRDFGQNEPFDIITLAGAGGQTGQDPVIRPSSAVGAGGAGRSSRDQHARDHQLGRNAVWGAGIASHGTTGGGSTFSRGDVHPNQVSSLDNRCQEIGSSGSQQQHPPRQMSKARNTSDDIWSLISQTPRY